MKNSSDIFELNEKESSTSLIVDTFVSNYNKGIGFLNEE